MELVEVSGSAVPCIAVQSLDGFSMRAGHARTPSHVSSPS